MDGRSLRGALASGAIAVLVLAACTSGQAEPEPLPMASPSVSPATTEPTASPTDPYAVPDEITPAYVERVYAALAEIEAEAIRELMRAYEADPTIRTLPAAVAGRLAAIYGQQEFLAQISAWERALAEDGSPFEGLLGPDELGQTRITVIRSRVLRGACIDVEAELDQQAQLAPDAQDATRGVTFWVVMVPSEEGQAQGNPTHWKMNEFQPLTDPSPPQGAGGAC